MKTIKGEVIIYKRGIKEIISIPIKKIIEIEEIVFFVHRDAYGGKSGWIITEASTGLIATRADKINRAEEYIKRELNNIKSSLDRVSSADKCLNTDYFITNKIKELMK